MPSRLGARRGPPANAVWIAGMLIAGLAGLAAGAEAQGDVRGRVLDAATRAPIAGAQVSATGTARNVLSDSLGRFTLLGLAAGERMVVVRMLGYATDSVQLTVADDEVLVRDFLLRRAASAAPSIAADAPSGGRPLLRLRVTDPGAQAVPYANVGVNGIRRIADDSGRLAIEIAPPQRIVVDVRRIGFRPRQVEVEVSGDSTLAIELEPSIQQLAGATITAAQPRKSLELSGFYRRVQDREKGINAGHFITEEDIERRRPHRITQMLEAIPTVRILRRKPPPRDGMGTSCLSEHDPQCWVPAGRNDCPMTVYFDGRRLNTLRVLDPTHIPYAYGLDQVAQTNHVAGIEVYSTANRAPPEYQMLNGTCGVILIWTQ